MRPKGLVKKIQDDLKKVFYKSHLAIVLKSILGLQEFLEKVRNSFVLLVAKLDMERNIGNGKSLFMKEMSGPLNIVEQRRMLLCMRII